MLPAQRSLGSRRFPYEASPNTLLQTVENTVDLSAPPDQVWAVVGQFGGLWHPLIASIQLTGDGVGQLRRVETIDGKQIIERLETMDNSQRFYRYTNVSGIESWTTRELLASSLKPLAAQSSGASTSWQMVNPTLW